ncbi:MAG: 4Fe-4S ferredoxin, iron-sulfur binding protein [Bacteroidetes bacterium]|nr:4Fe-4S ferredoxin, iron-sulfur binding protein [Bacteroidota bacterium]
MVRLEPESIELFLQAVRQRGFKTIGPRVRENAIVYDEIQTVADLPVGWTDDQEKAHYRLKRRSDGAFFGYNVGPQSWKQFLFPQSLKFFGARRNNGSFEVVAEEGSDAPQKLAFVGVRPCELHAIAIQDKVFLGGAYHDANYKMRRENVLIVAVNCSQVGKTCFCTSFGTGPTATSGFDIVLTEILTNEDHFFLADSASDRGKEILADLPSKPATEEEILRSRNASDSAAHSSQRLLETRGLKDLLYANSESPHWETIGHRCLSCANCTMVCPTCFCSSVEDVTDLAGTTAERRRTWDSCFTAGFSYIHGGSIRATTKSRYRQWLTHKLGSWEDQFGSSGCVGCGRCITWCPVGIDLTEEVQAFREKQTHLHPSS